MDRELARSGWTMFSVLVVRKVSVSVHIEAGAFTPTLTLKMSRYRAISTIRQNIPVRIIVR